MDEAHRLLLIRADANVQIGTGHVMRCLALAQAWQDAGGEVSFVAAMLVPALAARLEAEKVQVVRLNVAPGSADDAAQTIHLAREMGVTWVVVDGYHFDGGYQRAVKDAGLKLLCIDDNGDVDHYYADVVLNQNPHANPAMYASRESYTQLLLGTRYVLLRREFLKWRNWKREVPDIARRVLVTMGGSDPDNVTLKAIQALSQVEVDGLEATVVIGAGNPHTRELIDAARASRVPIRLETDALDMPELMAWADIAVSTAGGTLWELLFMQSLVLSYVRNSVQDLVINQLEEQGVVKRLGYPDQIDSQQEAACLEKIALSKTTREQMCASGRTAIDGEGAFLVVDLLLNNVVSMAPIMANEKAIFLTMTLDHFKSLNPDFEPHDDWKASYFESIRSNQKMFLRWIMIGDQRAGFIIYGIEDHRFLPRKFGMIYELYICPDYRRQGLARAIGKQVIEELKNKGVAKVQLEVMDGNDKAAALWKQLGFAKVSERYVLRG